MLEVETLGWQQQLARCACCVAERCTRSSCSRHPTLTKEHTDTVWSAACWRCVRLCTQMAAEHTRAHTRLEQPTCNDVVTNRQSLACIRIPLRLQPQKDRRLIADSDGGSAMPTDTTISAAATAWGPAVRQALRCSQLVRVQQPAAHRLLTETLTHGQVGVDDVPLIKQVDVAHCRAEQAVDRAGSGQSRQ